MNYTTRLGHSIISTRDRQRLGSTLDEARCCGGASPDLLDFLEDKLELAQCVLPPEIPDDVVTMNSKFRLCDRRTNELRTFFLCYPDSCGLSNEDLSVLDPLGCAVLGCHVGDEIVASSRGRTQRLRLVEVLY